MADVETLRRLRDVLARELETISQYEAHAAAEGDPAIKALFQHLADEEKEHVSEVYEALLSYDAVQKNWATSGEHAQAIRENRFQGSVSSGAVRDPGTPQVDPPNRSGIKPTPPTVGSLLGVDQT